MPGMSHLHQFFGNRTTNAASTTQSLLGQATTCSAAADGSAYWVPMLYQNGVAVPSISSLIYYRGGSHRGRGRHPAVPVRAADDRRQRHRDRAAARPTPWPGCARGWATCPRPRPTAGATRWCIQIRFPDCWDGRNLDSADHKSHMAYTVGGFCPSNYPVPVPLLEYNVRYKSNGTGAGITLASGSSITFHADFFNAWNQASLSGFIDSCLHTGKVCGTVT